MELTALLERMKMEHRLAQLDGVCEHDAKGDLDYKGFLTQVLEAGRRGPQRVELWASAFEGRPGCRAVVMVVS